MSKKLEQTLILLAAARKRATSAARKLRKLRLISAAEQRMQAANITDLQHQLTRAQERAETWESYYRMAVREAADAESMLAASTWLAFAAIPACGLASAVAALLALHHLGYL